MCARRVVWLCLSAPLKAKPFRAPARQTPSLSPVGTPAYRSIPSAAIHHPPPSKKTWRQGKARCPHNYRYPLGPAPGTGPLGLSGGLGRGGPTLREGTSYLDTTIKAGAKSHLRHHVHTARLEHPVRDGKAWTGGIQLSWHSAVTVTCRPRHGAFTVLDSTEVAFPALPQSKPFSVRRRFVSVAASAVSDRAPQLSCRTHASHKPAPPQPARTSN